MKVITERFRDTEGRIVIAVDIMSLNENFTIHFEFHADVFFRLLGRK